MLTVHHLFSCRATWAGSVMTHHSSSCQWDSNLFMETGQVSVRSTVTCCMSVRMSHYVSTYQRSLSAGTFTVTCPFYICPHTHPGSLVACSSAHTGTQTNTTISHTPTHPEMLEILSRGDNMFSSQSLTRSLMLSAWLKLTHSSVHARSWLKWHFSFFTFTFIFTFHFIACFSDICLILKPLSDRIAK